MFRNLRLPPAHLADLCCPNSPLDFIPRAHPAKSFGEPLIKTYLVLACGSGGVELGVILSSVLDGGRGPPPHFLLYNKKSTDLCLKMSTVRREGTTVAKQTI